MVGVWPVSSMGVGVELGEDVYVELGEDVYVWGTDVRRLTLHNNV